MGSYVVFGLILWELWSFKYSRFYEKNRALKKCFKTCQDGKLYVLKHVLKDFYIKKLLKNDLHVLKHISNMKLWNMFEVFLIDVNNNLYVLKHVKIMWILKLGWMYHGDHT
jgi:hypothetical protein